MGEGRVGGAAHALVMHSCRGWGGEGFHVQASSAVDTWGWRMVLMSVTCGWRRGSGQGDDACGCGTCVYLSQHAAALFGVAHVWNALDHQPFLLLLPLPILVVSCPRSCPRRLGNRPVADVACLTHPNATVSACITRVTCPIEREHTAPRAILGIIWHLLSQSTRATSPCPKGCSLISSYLPDNDVTPFSHAQWRWGAAVPRGDVHHKVAVTAIGEEARLEQLLACRELSRVGKRGA